jgi:hypothetical protein
MANSYIDLRTHRSARRYMRISAVSVSAALLLFVISDRGNSASIEDESGTSTTVLADSAIALEAVFSRMILAFLHLK